MRRAFSGVAAFDGIAIGQARVLVPPVIVIDRPISRELVPAEVARFRQALTATVGQLATLSARLEAAQLHEGHLILEAQRSRDSPPGMPGAGLHSLLTKPRYSCGGGTP